MSLSIVKGNQPRVVVLYNRDFEEVESDPENRAREDIKGIAEHIARVLGENGFETHRLGVTNDLVQTLLGLRQLKPTAVFNLCESINGDNRFEALIPQLMELEGIAYTGSDPMALSLALRKDKVKDLLSARGVPVPRGVAVTSSLNLPSLSPELDRLRFPIIVKPTREDASVGISSASVVHDRKKLLERVQFVLEQYRQPALAEEFIEGREIYVSILERVNAEPQVFPFHEIDFSDLPPDRPRIVSFEGKWVEDSPEYLGTRPVRCEGLSQEIRDRLEVTARRAFAAIGARDYGRVDMRLAPDGTPYVIDVNPNCDLSDLAGGFSRAAKAAGLSYAGLVLRIINLALARATTRAALGGPSVAASAGAGTRDIAGEQEAITVAPDSEGNDPLGRPA